ncbi:hypothetical protein MOBT1_002642 [Malassezia obtusa]|uniref:Autophagy-related protein 101 n=1 Tax=Malassezia obtusa TaxID=76774 RepID=A0AAF0E2C2_9BASI|nr:hypothetical protein MOBT1_002642 [Malassezia obtusa]
MQSRAPPLFTHEVVRRALTQTVRREHAHAALEGMLHTILFFRLLGTIEPATRDVLGAELVRVRLTQPRIQDAATQARITEACTEILTRMDAETSREGVANVEVLVSWHQPDEARPAPAQPRAEDRARPTHPIFHSPYSWLASALAGGKSDLRDGHMRKVLTRDRALDTLSDAFEQWVLSVHVDYDAASARAPDLNAYLLAALTFANKHQDQLPAVGDASLTPFPYSIGSTLRQ